MAFRYLIYRCIELEQKSWVRPHHSLVAQGHRGLGRGQRRCGVLLFIVILLRVLWLAQGMDKLIEIDASITIDIHLLDHVLD